MKKFLSITFALLMVITATASEVFVVDNLKYETATDQGIKAVTIRGFNDTSDVPSALTIPNSVTYNGTTYWVTSIGIAAFRDLNNLTSVDIPNSVVYIDSYAFWSCTNLTAIHISNSVTFIESSVFEKTAWFDNQPDGLVYAGLVAYKYKGDMPRNTSIIIREGTKGISPGAFSNCKNMTSITIPNSVVKIGVCAFWNCTGLTSFTLPSSVTEISREMFSGCTGLTSFVIPNTVTSIGGAAFRDCTGIPSFTIPNSVKSIDYCAFDGCTGLRTITVPNSVTYLGSGVFSDCSNLTTAIIGDSVPNLNGATFSHCTHLSKVTIGKSVTSFGSQDFLLCRLLRSLKIPDSVTSIGYAAFYFSGLNSITIPSSVRSIDADVFGACGSLRVVHSKITNIEEVPVGGTAFDGVNTNLCVIKVPRGTANKYRNTAPWSNFANIEEISYDKPGDMDGDGVVNGDDLNTLINLLLGNGDANALPGNADIDGDGEINGSDINMVINYLLGKE